MNPSPKVMAKLPLISLGQGCHPNFENFAPQMVEQEDLTPVSATVKCYVVCLHHSNSASS